MLATGVGGALLGCGLGIGLGLLMDTRSARAWVGMVLVVAAFVLAVTAASPQLFWAAPAFAVTFGVTVTLVEAHTLREHPLLMGESFARRVALILFHAKDLRDAARFERDHHVHKVR